MTPRLRSPFEASPHREEIAAAARSATELSLERAAKRISMFVMPFRLQYADALVRGRAS